jgi:hypothetical protein
LNTPASSPRGGFTRVEVMLAMGLLLLGMTSILGLLSFGAALSRTAQLRAAAAAAAEAVVADLEETLFPLVADPVTGELVAGEPRAVLDRAVPGHDGILYSAVAVGDPSPPAEPAGPRRYRVDVALRWSSAGQARTRTFTTLLLREVPFGERMRRLFVAGEEPASDP